MPAIAVVKKAKLLALLYTLAASYTDATPRWRILLPTSTTLPPDERAKLVARVNGFVWWRVLARVFHVLAEPTTSVPSTVIRHTVPSIPQGDYIDRRGDLDANALRQASARSRVSSGPNKQSDASQRYEKPPVAKVRAALVAIRKGDVDRAKWVSIGTTSVDRPRPQVRDG